MNIIIDPLLFWLPDNPAKSDIDTALEFVDETILVGRTGYELVSSAVLWRKIITHNYRKISQFVRSHELHPRLRELESRVRMVAWQVQQTETEGLRELINYANIPDATEWMTAVAQVVAHSINTGQQFGLMARLFVGRNLVEHISMQHCRLYEKSHWEVFIRLNNGLGLQEYVIPCVSSLRNLLVPWTIRYDDKLPDTAPNDGIAFVPKANWADRDVAVFRAFNSKICWIDAEGNAWSDTNTPGHAYHWDVFPVAAWVKKKFGEHVNITRYGTDDRNRVPGQVHH